MNEVLINEVLAMPEVTLVGVTKKHTKEEVDELAALGVTVFGENRVQEFLEKYDPAYTWHLIGHLQTNKVKYIIGKVDVIESVDSLKLAREIEKQAARHNICQKVLIELKISDDPNKTGLPLNELDELIVQIEQMEHIEWKGLMCIASHTEDLEKVGKEFETMHDLYLALQKKYPQLDTLSMGMSQDYQIAIEHGSNMVRIGTALFE
ncbi:YggS family pyridoxal phosphate-dependent enzyme [uncultured Dubosiella sp.]|uniref:YggS family pyridoxal phosphate-dependent enzyme n=1 Tax=uncultured Dubosiella sp. TaxID=1937011 RepID=UPI0020887185|nr:YggS family pyridoxal phosphate-dependent enzyme [uncultured Dubosiella sp.]GJM56334.1 YggS family pyridoxal phosphate enzyme [Erysipelotrichaceae bacterium OPF54]